MQPHGPRGLRPFHETGELFFFMLRHCCLFFFQYTYEDLQVFEIPGSNLGWFAALTIPCAVDGPVLEKPPWC